jgi:organic hydroperoxide reductase OsmC/OhrA
VMLLPNAEGACRLAVGLVVSLPSVRDPEVARALVTEADRACSYSNAIRGNVGVWITVNGRPIEERAEPLVARRAA